MSETDVRDMAKECSPILALKILNKCLECKNSHDAELTALRAQIQAMKNCDNCNAYWPSKRCLICKDSLGNIKNWEMGTE